MFRRLHIERFRSIHDATLDFGRVNLFIGGNGAGKSNVLEALGIVSAALGRGVDAVTLAQRGVRLSRPNLFKSSFRGYDHPLTFGLEADFAESDERASTYKCAFYGGKDAELRFHTEKLTVDGADVLTRTPRYGARIHGGPAIKPERLEPERSLWDIASQLASVDGPALDVIDTLAHYAIFSPQTAVMRGVARVESPLLPLGLSGSGLARCLGDVIDAHNALGGRSKLRRRLGRILDLWALTGWTADVEVDEPDPEILPKSVNVAAGELVLYFRDRFMRSDRSYLSPYDASEGTLYLAFVGALMGHRNTPPIFALDNVDGTLNPALVRRLVEQIVATVCSTTARKHPWLPQQVFLTTHNPTALDALDLFDPDHRVYIVYRDTGGKPAGATRFYRLQPPPGMTRDEWVVAQSGLNLSELWIQGRIREALG